MTESFYELLHDGAESLNIKLNDEQSISLYKYYQMILEKNKVMNLTTITSEEDFVCKHILDSMSIVKINVSRDVSRETSTFNVPRGFQVGKTSYLKDVSRETLEESKIIDVGTGAGFPGIILKILFPDSYIVLNDSLNKRLTFINEVIDSLKLKNIKTIHGRAEEIAHDSYYREKFDYAISRAVSKMSVLSEYDLPFVRIGGYFIAMKGGNYNEECIEAEKSIRLMGGRVENIIEYTLPGSDYKRSLIMIKKIKMTSSKYPRKAGTPGRNPL